MRRSLFRRRPASEKLRRFAVESSGFVDWRLGTSGLSGRLVPSIIAWLGVEVTCEGPPNIESRPVNHEMTGDNWLRLPHHLWRDAIGLQLVTLIAGWATDTHRNPSTAQHTFSPSDFNTYDNLHRIQVATPDSLIYLCNSWNRAISRDTS
ncbi:uncharacterized protein ATNIH1004_002164 [Aspergillus tanneri]|uniref:Uncharacterized protein n=1 Tax=Aspergillus tanneri TaxID=1220188 RepID=A0A5M9MX58_9EURO|nr:uncharacterized protein ATNIH1004_002164 [Aspergillus tanneri]KAA8649493.1 hypothetical protein ATNIH1004_002164 [Aspergillus tanneri]